MPVLYETRYIQAPHELLLTGADALLYAAAAQLGLEPRLRYVFINSEYEVLCWENNIKLDSTCPCHPKALNNNSSCISPCQYCMPATRGVWSREHCR